MNFVIEGLLHSSSYARDFLLIQHDGSSTLSRLNSILEEELSSRFITIDETKCTAQADATIIICLEQNQARIIKSNESVMKYSFSQFRYFEEKKRPSDEGLINEIKNE